MSRKKNFEALGYKDLSDLGLNAAFFAREYCNLSRQDFMGQLQRSSARLGVLKITRDGLLELLKEIAFWIENINTEMEYLKLEDERYKRRKQRLKNARDKRVLGTKSRK